MAHLWEYVNCTDADYIGYTYYKRSTLIGFYLCFCLNRNAPPFYIVLWLNCGIYCLLSYVGLFIAYLIPECSGYVLLSYC